MTPTPENAPERPSRWRWRQLCYLPLPGLIVGIWLFWPSDSVPWSLAVGFALGIIPGIFLGLGLALARNEAHRDKMLALTRQATDGVDRAIGLVEGLRTTRAPAAGLGKGGAEIRAKTSA